MNDRIQGFYLTVLRWNFFVHFLEEFEDSKKSFQNQMTFTLLWSEQMQGITACLFLNFTCNFLYSVHFTKENLRTNSMYLTLKRTDVDGRVADEQRTACCFSRSSCHNKTQQTCSTFEAQTNPLRTPIILFWKSGSSIWFRPRTPD